MVKGAGFRSQCVVLRRFESCPLHHYWILILLDLESDIFLPLQPAILYPMAPRKKVEAKIVPQTWLLKGLPGSLEYLPVPV